MLTEKEQLAVLEFFEKECVPNLKERSTIAIDAQQINRYLNRNTRRLIQLADINDLLSGNEVANRLGMVLTLCEFEQRIYYIIRADFVWSTTRSYHRDRFVIGNHTGSLPKDLLDQTEQSN